MHAARTLSSFPHLAPCELPMATQSIQGALQHCRLLASLGEASLAHFRGSGERLRSTLKNPSTKCELTTSTLFIKQTLTLEAVSKTNLLKYDSRGTFQTHHQHVNTAFENAL